MQERYRDKAVEATAALGPKRSVVPKKKPEPATKPPENERIGVILPSALLADVDDARSDLRRSGKRVSFSGLVEVALRELIDRDDLAAVLEEYGAGARRQKPKD